MQKLLTTIVGITVPIFCGHVTMLWQTDSVTAEADSGPKVPANFFSTSSSSFSTTYSTSASFFVGRTGSLLLNSIRRSSHTVS